MGFKRKLFWTALTLSITLLGRWLFTHGEPQRPHKIQAHSPKRQRRKKTRHSDSTEDFPVKGSLKESFGEAPRKTKDPRVEKSDFESNLTPSSSDLLH